MTPIRPRSAGCARGFKVFQPSTTHFPGFICINRHYSGSCPLSRRILGSVRFFHRLFKNHVTGASAGPAGWAERPEVTSPASCVVIGHSRSAATSSGCRKILQNCPRCPAKSTPGGGGGASSDGGINGAKVACTPVAARGRPA